MKNLSLYWRSPALPLGALLLVALLSACQGDPPAEEPCPEGSVPTEQGGTPHPSQGGDDHGDTPAAATAIAPGAGSAELTTAEDRDVFSFPVVAGHVYRFTCLAERYQYNSTCAVRMLSATGEPVPTSGVVWQFGYKAPANGTAYAELRPASASTVFPRSSPYLLEDAGPDDHGDTPETATVLHPPAVSVPAQIELLADLDVFAFDAAAGHVYHFLCEGLSCRVRLRDAAGTLVHEQLNRLDHEFAQAGRYTLEVSSIPQLLGTGTGSYRYSLEDAGPDDSGDDEASAREISFGQATSGKYETAQDVDVFRFTAPAGQAVRLSCQSPDGSSPCFIRLKDSTGTLLEERRGSVAYEAGAQPVLLFATVSSTSTASPSLYTALLENLGPDDYGDSPEAAYTLVGNPAEIAGRLETGSDSDFFQREATVGRFYRARCLTALEVDCGMRAHGPAGPITETERVPLELKATGPFTLEVFGFGSPNDRGDYRLIMEELGLDDHGDTGDTGTRITLGDTLTGHLDASSDIDVFLVALEGGRTYEIAPLSEPAMVFIRGPFGTYELVADPLSGSPRTFTPQHSGDHRVEVRQVRNKVQSSYQLRLRL